MAEHTAANMNMQLQDKPLNIVKLMSMFNFKSSTGFQGSGYLVLNGLRVINIVVLAATAAACFLMMIFAKLPNAFQFFTDINLLFIACVCGLLIWTELPFGRWKSWINETWPAFAPDKGFTWLGIAMFLMGCHTLGELSNEPYTKKTIGTSIWRVVAASCCLGIAFGTINVLASLLYTNGEISARQVRSKGATSGHYASHSASYPEDGYSQRSDSIRKEKTRSRLFAKFKPSISRPILPHHDVEHGPVAHDELPFNDRSSPIVPQVQRPPTALHPAINGGPRSSIYSEVSHLNRFDENRF